jgi:hypothetical protein
MDKPLDTRERKRRGQRCGARSVTKDVDDLSKLRFASLVAALVAVAAYSEPAVAILAVLAIVVGAGLAWLMRAARKDDEPLSIIDRSRP